MTINRDQAEQLATLAAAIRAEVNASRWDRPGIVAAIGRVKDRPLADVALAVIRAADDPTLETPGAIGNLTASCWAERKVERRVHRPNTPANTCDECGRHALEPHPTDHPFVSELDARRRADAPKPPIRELIAAATEEPTP